MIFFWRGDRGGMVSLASIVWLYGIATFDTSVLVVRIYSATYGRSMRGYVRLGEFLRAGS